MITKLYYQCSNMKTNHFITLGLSIALLILLSTRNLTAQININDKSKPINTKSVSENTILPSEVLEGVEKYREFHFNPELQTKSAVHIGTEIEFDFGFNNKFKGTVITVTEYIEGITAVTAKIQGLDFAYGYMAISNKGVTMCVNVPELNKRFFTTQFNQKQYLLEYSESGLQKRNSFKCAAINDLQIQETIQNQAIGETFKSSPNTEKKSLLTKNADSEITHLKLMYVFTSAAINWIEWKIGEKNKASINDVINREVTLSMLESQLVLDNSNIKIKLELIRIYQTESLPDHPENTLFAAIADNDGMMDDIHTVRNAEDIDIVIVANKVPFGILVAGIAFELNSEGGNRNRNGFVAINEDYIFGDYVVIHEIGHLFGCEHLIDQLTSPAPSSRLFKHGTAWKGIINNKYFTTVMGYTASEHHADKNTYGRIPYFSSANISLQGVIIGNDSLSDNARVMNKSRHLVETYGKGMQIGPKTFYRKTYGYPDPIFELAINKHNFDLRTGDKVILSREEGEVLGKYDIIPRIIDTNGNDVTESPYYKGYAYMASDELIIRKRDLKCSYFVQAKDKIYDGTTNVIFDFSRFYDTSLKGSLVKGDSVKVQLGALVGTFFNANVGDKKLVTTSGNVYLTGDKAYCYELYPYVGELEASILPAPLTIAAKETEIVFGTNPTTVNINNAYTIKGLVNNENRSVLQGALKITIDPSITANSPIGIYRDAIHIQGCTASNYEITYKTADLVIKKTAGHPSRPSGLSGEAISETSIKLTWNIARQASTYNIKRSTSENGTYTTVATSLTDTAYTQTGLTPDTKYWYKVSSQNASGESFDSNPVSVNTPPELLSQTITFDAIPKQNITNATYQLNATASSGLPVSYTSSNTNVATVNESGVVTFVAAGTTTITAGQSGNKIYKAAASVSQNLIIEKVSQTITFDAIPTQNIANATYQLNATASSGLPVSYTSSNTEVATINQSGLITFVSAGTTTITADQNGNEIYKAAAPVSQNLIIEKVSQSITFDAIPMQNIAKATYQLNATASSRLPVSYTSGNTNVATVNESGVITFVAAGTTLITANQTGDAIYKAAAPVSQNLIISISNNNNLVGLSINDKSWDIQNSYIIDCGNNTARLQIIINTPEYATLWNGTTPISDKKILFENNNKAFNKDITFQIKAQDGTSKAYTLNVQKYFAFKDIVIQDNDILTVDNNPSTNGGYIFKSYKWFKNGTLVGSEQTYTESTYEASANYSVGVITTEDEILHTCSATIEPIKNKNPMTNMLYPNPVPANSVVSLNLDNQDSTGNVTIEIYDLKGILIKTETIPAASAISFNTPSHSGIYIVKVKTKSKKRTRRLIVK